MFKITQKIQKAAACTDGLSSHFCLVMGLQWGQEGKVKLVKELSKQYDYSVRYNGGVMEEGTILPNGQKLNLLPTGIINERPKTIIGNGVVVYSQAIIDDINALEDNSIDYKNRILISNR